MAAASSSTLTPVLAAVSATRPIDCASSWKTVLVAGTGQRPTNAEMEQFCHRNIADYRRPKKFIWVDDLPRNAYGKVLKRELRNRYAETAHE